MDQAVAADLVLFRTGGSYDRGLMGSEFGGVLTALELVFVSRLDVVCPRVGVEALIAGDRVPDWIGGCAGEPSS
jgi:diaminopimelate decarboxylase